MRSSTISKKDLKTEARTQEAPTAPAALTKPADKSRLRGIAKTRIFAGDFNRIVRLYCHASRKML